MAASSSVVHVHGAMRTAAEGSILLAAIALIHVCTPQVSTATSGASSYMYMCTYMYHIALAGDNYHVVHV